jgi:hypothetical protein
MLLEINNRCHTFHMSKRLDDETTQERDNMTMKSLEAT